MAFSYRRLFFHGSTFCWCIPVRFGVIAMSALGLVITALLSVALWYEVSEDVDSESRVAFILAGLMETLLVAASILGLVGAITRKQLFTQIYVYILYVHFLINIGIAGYLLYEVHRVSRNAEAVVCQDAGAKSQCQGLLSFAKGVYWGIALVVLIVEFYGAVIATRYLNQLKREKLYSRSARRDTERAFELKHPDKDHRYSRLPDGGSSHIPENSLQDYPLHSNGIDFDPYAEFTLRDGQARQWTNVGGVQVGSATNVDAPRPAAPIEVGYGGGSWTHEGIAEEEKERLKRQNLEARLDGDGSISGPARKPSVAPLPVYSLTPQ